MMLHVPAPMRDRVRIYRMSDIMLDLVFVMPRHYLSLPSFVSFQQRLCGLVRNKFREEMSSDKTSVLPARPEPSFGQDRAGMVLIE
jgi:hypothetical protein